MPNVHGKTGVDRCLFLCFSALDAPRETSAHGYAVRILQVWHPNSLARTFSLVRSPWLCSHHSRSITITLMNHRSLINRLELSLTIINHQPLLTIASHDQLILPPSGTPMLRPWDLPPETTFAAGDTNCLQHHRVDWITNDCFLAQVDNQWFICWLIISDYWVIIHWSATKTLDINEYNWFVWVCEWSTGK